jgi:hypothetical protein
MWTSLGPLQKFDYLNQLDGIGTTLRNFLKALRTSMWTLWSVTILLSPYV